MEYLNRVRGRNIVLSKRQSKPEDIMKSCLGIFVAVISVVYAVPVEDTTRPCGTDITLNCVRQYFADNAECLPLPQGTPHYTENLPMHLSNIDATVVTSTVFPSGLEGNFEEFYIDEETNTLVISINYDGLVCDAPGTILAFSQQGAEPVTTRAYIKATYPTILTATIPLPLTAKSLENAYISAYFEDSNAQFQIGPTFSQSSDPVISAAYDGLLADIPTALREIFSFKASYFFLISLQRTICNFGLPPNVQHPYDITVLKNILENSAEDEIVEPCAGSRDIRACVADYFLEQGHCSAVGTPDDEPVQRSLLDSYVPSLNYTADIYDATLTGLNGNIQKFYINKVTNNLVLTVDFPNLVMESPHVPIFIEQRGAPPKVVVDSNKDTYHVVLNAVIPLNNGLTKEALEMAYVTTYPTAKTTFENDHEYYEEQDEQVAAIMNELHNSDTITLTKEMFVTEGPSSLRAYIQKYICHFDGLSLTVS